MKNIAFVAFIVSVAAMDSEIMWISAVICLGSLLLLVWLSRKEDGAKCAEK